MLIEFTKDAKKIEQDMIAYKLAINLKLWNQMQEFGTAVFAASLAFAVGLAISSLSEQLQSNWLAGKYTVDNVLYIVTTRTLLCLSAIVYVVYDWYSSRNIIAQIAKKSTTLVRGIVYRFLIDIIAALCGYMIIAAAIHNSRWVLFFIAIHLFAGLLWIVFCYFDRPWRNLHRGVQIILISETVAHVIGCAGAITFYSTKYDNSMSQLFDPIEYWYEPVIIIVGFVIFSAYISPYIIERMISKIADDNVRLLEEEARADA